MKRNHEKLTLKKEAIYNLDDVAMNKVKGGAAFGLSGDNPQPTPTPVTERETVKYPCNPFTSDPCTTEY